MKNLTKTQQNIRDRLKEKLKINEMNEMINKSALNKFDVDNPINVKIKRPAIELPFMSEGEHVVNQQEND